MASIQKRGEKTYRITVSDGRDRDGKQIRHTKTVTFDDDMTEPQMEKEIEKAAVLFEAEILKGSVYDTNITFEDFTNKWIEDYAKVHLQPITVEGYKMHLNTKILPAIGHINLNKLKPIHLIKFYENLTEDGVRLDGKPGGYSTRIIRYQHQIISSILQTAVYWQVINDNVARRVKPPKGIKGKQKNNFFNESEIKLFLEYVLEKEPLEYGVIAFIAAYGGLRKGEILGLTWEDIDFKNNVININKAMSRANNKEFIKEPKNKSSIRKVTLPESVMLMLKEIKTKSESERVIPYGYDFPSRWFKRTLRNYNEEHEDKLPEHVTLHGLRHTSATLLIASNMDIKTISSRLGHRDVSTTLNIYSHALDSKDKEAADKLEDMINLDKTK